jgi:hypothetical protein
MDQVINHLETDESAANYPQRCSLTTVWYPV